MTEYGTVKYEILNPYPNAGSVTDSVTVNGSFDSGTYSFMVLAWYSGTESDFDLAGYYNATVSAWRNKTMPDSSTVVISWTSPSRTPDHYAVYAQYSPTFNWNSSTIKIANVSLSNNSVTVNDFSGTTLASGIPLTYTWFYINPISMLEGIVRQRAEIGYDGNIINKSYNNNITYDTLNFTIPRGSLSGTQSGYYASILQKCLKYGLKCRLTDTVGSPLDTSQDPYIRYYYGQLINFDWISPDKSSMSEYKLSFLIDQEDLTQWL